MATARISNKDVREVIAYAQDLGFEWDGTISGGGHVKLTHPAGGRVTLGITIRSGNRNQISTVKREARRIGIRLD